MFVKSICNGLNHRKGKIEITKASYYLHQFNSIQFNFYFTAHEYMNRWQASIPYWLPDKMCM